MPWTALPAFVPRGPSRSLPQGSFAGKIPSKQIWKLQANTSITGSIVFAKFIRSSFLKTNSGKRATSRHLMSSNTRFMPRANTLSPIKVYLASSPYRDTSPWHYYVQNVPLFEYVCTHAWIFYGQVSVKAERASILACPGMLCSPGMFVLQTPAPVVPDGGKVLAAIAFAGVLSSICVEGMIETRSKFTNV